MERKRVMTRQRLAARMRSWLRISFETAANHLRSEAGPDGDEGFRRGCQDPLTEFADREMGHRSKGMQIVRIEDEASHLVGLVRHDALLEEMPERKIRKGVTGGDTFPVPMRPRCRRESRRSARG